MLFGENCLFQKGGLTVSRRLPAEPTKPHARWSVSQPAFWNINSVGLSTGSHYSICDIRHINHH